MAFKRPEPEPGGPDRLCILVGNNTSITAPAPSRDEFRKLGMLAKF